MKCTPGGSACRRRDAQIQKVPGCDHAVDAAAAVAKAAAAGRIAGSGVTP